MILNHANGRKYLQRDHSDMNQMFYNSFRMYLSGFNSVAPILTWSLVCKWLTLTARGSTLVGKI